MSVNHKKIEVDLDPKTVGVSFDCGTVKLELSPSFKVREPSIKIYDVRRWAHNEICLYLFGQENSRCLQSIPGFLISETGKSTPDYVSVTSDNRVIIHELKTTLGKSSGAYVAATRQYLHVLRSAVLEYEYSCLGVGPESVTWDDALELSEESLKFMVSIMKISKRIQDHLIESGILLDDFVLSDTVLKIPQVLLNKENELFIDDALIDYWKELNVSAVSGSQLMLNAAKNVPDISVTRSRDEKTLKNMYTNGVVSSDMPFKLGLMIPTIDKGDGIELPVTIDNRKLQSLWTAYRWKFKQGQKSCRITLSDVSLLEINPDDEDVRRGLWAGLISGKQAGIFRESNVIGENRSDEPYPIQNKFNHGVNKQVVRKYIPTDMDLNPVTSMLCRRVPVEMREPRQTLVDQSSVEIPFQDEYWFQSTKFWQRLVEEINIGRYSAQGKWNSFHCHQICPYNAWLFVHGTGLHSHQFYYLIFHTDHLVCWPNDVHEFSPGWWCTRCVKSLRSDKINQHLNILERLISLRYYWNSVLGYGTRADKHFSASLLIAFDSKQQTIDTLSLFRYIYMEFCKSAETRNPAKIVTKMPPEVRSPVLAWIIYRMRKLVLDSNQLQPRLKKTKQNTSKMNFKGLVSWVDFLPIKNFSVILSLSYMHYATSHPVSIGLHGKIQIMSKLLKEERKLDLIESDLCAGIGDLNSLGPHEYSAAFVKKMAQVSSKRLLYVYPTFNHLMRMFSSRLYRWKLSDFATFKKSTMVTGSDPGKRAYCFEEVLKLTENLNLNPLNASNYSPFIELSKIVRYQETEPRNRNVSIFVKDQQSGLREIFVLPINLRILVKSMEIFARIVNETFPNETLSYPKRKDLVVTEHIRKSQVQVIAMKRNIKEKNERVILLRYSSSSDAKAWCQQFCMPVFGCFITSLLSEAYGQESIELVKYFCFILNQITGKHIHVDDRVKKWLRLSRDIKTENSCLQDLLDMYQGRKSGLYEDGSIINKSNMMQGIPHETSSSLHASYLMFMTMVLKSLIMEQLPNRLKCIKLGLPVIDSLVSSDDSGILFSLPVLVQEENGRLLKSHEIELTDLKKLLYKLGYSIELNKRLFSAEASIEKSTIFAESPVFEFNSRFYIGRSIATAEIKFAVSPLTLGFHTRIVDRIDEALSSLKGCVKEGLRQDQLMVIQQCIRRMHIRFLYSNWWEHDLSSKLDGCCSPRLGVLPMVKKGMIGFLNLSMMSDYALTLKSPSYWPIRNSVQHLITGSDSYSLILRVGRKYMQTLKTLGISKESILSEMESKGIGPMRFLRKELPESMLIKIKLLNPGARTALSFVDLSKIHMASCYASTTQCITHDSQGKLSLQECLEIEDLGIGKPFQQPVTQFYKEISYIEEVLNQGYEDYLEKDQTKISTEIVFKEEKRDYFSLLIRCWETGFSAGEQEQLVSIQEIIPEIKDTLEETVKGFESVFSLEAYLRSIEQNPFSVNVLSYATGTKNFVQTYQTYLRSNWSREHSYVIYGPGIQRIKNEILSNSASVRWFDELYEKLSILHGSIKFPPIDRGLITSIHDYINTNTLSAEGHDRDLKNLLIYLGNRNRSQRFDLRGFRSQKRRILGYKPDEIYIFDRGCWYILSRLQGEWVLLKDEQSPRLSYIECRYENRDNLPIWINPNDLRVKIDKVKGLMVHSNYWNSDCFMDLKKAFPHLRTDHAWLEITHGPFRYESYLDVIPKEYKSEMCLKLLAAVHLDADRSCLKFDFWVMLSDIIAEEEFSKEEKALARCIMTIATEEEIEAESEYDPFQELVREELDEGEQEEISKFMINEMMTWMEEDPGDEEESLDYAALTLGLDFGEWCMEDLVESYQERGQQPRNTMFHYHWKYRIKVGYLNSFRVYAKDNEHNPVRARKIEAARGKMVFLNPERFGQDFPD